MSNWQVDIVFIVVQVTVITLMAIALIRFSPRDAARRHTIAVIALGMVLLSPVLTVFLPWRWDGISLLSSDAVSVDANANGNAASAVLSTREVLQPELQVLPFRQNQQLPTSSPASISVSRDVAAEATSPTVSEPTAVFDHQASSTRSLLWSAAFLFNVCVVLWIVGTVLSLLRWVVRRRRLRPIYRSLQPANLEAAHASVLASVRNAVGQQQLSTIYVSPQVATPVVLGIRRPIVVIPEDMPGELNSGDLTNVLIHECAHIVRRDPWLHLAQQFLGMCWWFHPGVHWVSQKLSQSREELCDNFVLRHGNAAEFAQTLLDLTERCGRPQVAVSPLGLFSWFGKRWNLERRITDLLNPARDLKLRTERHVVAVIVTVFLSCCVFLGGTQATRQNPVAENSEAKAAEASEQANQSPKRDEAISTALIEIRGECFTEQTGDAIVAKIQLFRSASYREPAELVATTITDENGEFRFRDVVVQRGVDEPASRERFAVIATAEGHATGMAFPRTSKDLIEVELEMSNEPAALSGVVQDASGKPVEGATVFLPFLSHHPVPGVQTTVTDALGRYEVSGLTPWNVEATKTFEKKTGMGTAVSHIYFYVRHPDYPNHRPKYRAIPSNVDVTLYPPSIVEGKVVDMVAGKPVSNALVNAQGIVRGDWFETRTDRDGRYTLRLPRNHFNIWSQQEGRMPIAIKAFAAVPGERSTGQDIHMVRGGFVTGRYLTASGEPADVSLLPLGRRPKVAHYGPARPRSGAAVTSTDIKADGTYRLHVAPGRNYVYMMGGDASAWVDVGDGQEVELDLTAGQEVGGGFADDSDTDMLLGQILREEAFRKEWAAYNVDPSVVEQSKPVSPAAMRRDSKTGRLLTLLDDMNHNPRSFSTEWVQAIYDVANLGSDAVPELIAELDRTNDDRMLRCLGFMLRAIGDKRAVPALIRAIPRTLRAPGSDFGGMSLENQTLNRFMLKHDADPSNPDGRYVFGRPVTEVFAALHSLTGQNFQDDELAGVFRRGTSGQIAAQEKLFVANAHKWSAWWEVHWQQHVKDDKYASVGLKPLEKSNPQPLPLDQKLKPDSGGSGSMLASIVNAKPGQRVAYDIDTGRTSELPKQWQGNSLTPANREAILKWAADEGFDLLGDEYPTLDGQTVSALRVVGMQAWELEPHRWKSITDAVTVKELQAEGRAVTDDWLLATASGKVTPKAHAPFLFVTREGTPGLLYVGVPATRPTSQPLDQPTHDRNADLELDPQSHMKGRRFGYTFLAPPSGE